MQPLAPGDQIHPEQRGTFAGQRLTGQTSERCLSIADKNVARSLCCEMHAGFQTMRGALTMNRQLKLPGAGWNVKVQKDIDRIVAMWDDARARFGRGGPYLFGSFCIADAFFAPVAQRFLGYGVKLPAGAKAYVDTLAAMPAFQKYAEAARKETSFYAPDEPYRLGAGRPRRGSLVALCRRALLGRTPRGDQKDPSRVLFLVLVPAAQPALAAVSRNSSSRSTSASSGPRRASALAFRSASCVRSSSTAYAWRKKCRKPKSRRSKVSDSWLTTAGRTPGISRAMASRSAWCQSGPAGRDPSIVRATRDSADSIAEYP